MKYLKALSEIEKEKLSEIEKVDEVTESRLRALSEIEKEKLRVDKAYNKRVKKSFQIGELV
jgi:hypothetical protein